MTQFMRHQARWPDLLGCRIEQVAVFEVGQVTAVTAFEDQPVGVGSSRIHADDQIHEGK